MGAAGPLIQPDMVTGVILAGGRGRRMGAVDKALLPLGGRPLALHVSDRLASQAGCVWLNTNGDGGNGLSGLGLPLVADSRPDRPGPLAGVEAALERMRTPWLLSAAVDLPFLPRNLLSRLAAARGDDPMAVAVSGGRLHPVVGLWSKSLLPELKNWLDEGGRRVRDWVTARPHGKADFPQFNGEDPFFNVNQPADLARAELRLARAAHGERS